MKYEWQCQTGNRAFYPEEHTPPICACCGKPCVKRLSRFMPDSDAELGSYKARSGGRSSLRSIDLHTQHSVHLP